MPKKFNKEKKMVNSRQSENAVEQVFETKDYSKFKSLPGNRPLKTQHLNRLKASFLIKDLQVPIVVNEKFEVIDGQHRLEVLKGLELPVVYLQKKGFGLKEIHVLNTARKNWGWREFMNSYADLGMEQYIKFREFMKKYRIGFRESLAMLLGLIQTGNFYMTGFADGEFKIKNLEKAEENAEKILMLKDLYLGWKRRNFVVAMLRLFQCPKYNHIEFLSKLKRQREKLFDVGSVDAYLKLIDEIYNHGRRGTNVSFYWELKKYPSNKK